MASHFKKREGWWGVAVTALLCGGFLWWWFQPAPVDATTARDPLYWLELARKELGPTEPPASAWFEALVVALSYQQAGKDSVAAAIANAWLPAAWSGALAARSESGQTAGGNQPAGPDPALAPVVAKLTEAREALDQLEVERGRAVFHEAVVLTDTLADPQRAHALWLMAARQARSGFAADARQTREGIHPAADPRSLPAWVISECIHADMAAPVLAWCEAHPAEALPVLTEWVVVLRDRLLHRETGELSQRGPRADPASTHPAADESLLSIHHAVQNNQLRPAEAAARQLPPGLARASGFLTIARTLAWDAESPGG